MPTSSPTPALVSVGYEQRRLAEFIDLLLEAQVDLVIDVRLTPISRQAGFSKTTLTRSLAGAGIAYRHEPRLGNPKDNRGAFRRGFPDARERYQKHLDQAPSSVVDEIVDLALRSRVALLCFEREPDECHRSCIVAEALVRQPNLAVEQR